MVFWQLYLSIVVGLGLAVCQATGGRDEGGGGREAAAAIQPHAPTGGELEAQEVVYLGLVDGTVLAWSMQTGGILWNFTSMGVAGAESYDVVSEFGKPSFQRLEGQFLVTELSGQGSNYVLDSDGGLFEQPWNTRGLLDEPGGTSQILASDSEDGEHDGVLFTADKVVDVYGVDPVTEGLSMKYCRLANRPDESCGTYDDRGRNSRTLIVTRTTYTMTEHRAGTGEVLWNRSSSFYDMKMSHPGIGGHMDQPWSIVQRAATPNSVPPGEQTRWKVDAFDSDGQVRFTTTIPARLVASFTLANGHVNRNAFNDCGDTTDAECWELVANGALQDRVSVFKHKNAYFALPAVEIPRAPLNPMPSPFAPAPSDKSSPMIGDGTPTAILPDADCDADDLNLALEPAGPGWGFDGGSTRTDITTDTDTPQSLMLQTDSYRGFWRKEETTTTSTSTAIAVFTRQDAVVPIRVGPPNDRVDEIQLHEADDASGDDSSGTSDNRAYEALNIQDDLHRDTSTRNGKTITVRTPDFLDDIPINMTSVVAAALVVLAVGILIGYFQSGRLGTKLPLRRSVPDTSEISASKCDADLDSHNDEPAGMSESDTGSALHTEHVSTDQTPGSKRSPKPLGKFGKDSPSRSPRGPDSKSIDAPVMENLDLLDDGSASHSSSSSSSDVSSVDNSSDDGVPSSTPELLKSSKSEPNLSRPSAIGTKKLHHVEDFSSSSSHLSSENSRSRSHSRSPQLMPSLRSLHAGGFDLSGAQLQSVESTRSVVSRYAEEFVEKRRLGKGGQGTVFVAHRTLDGIDYAVKKVLLPRGEKDRDRVLREVKSLAQLEHMNIVRYYNAWIEQIFLGDLEYMLNPPSPTGGSVSHFSLTSLASEMTSSWAGTSENADTIREVLFIQMKLYAQETLQQYLAPAGDPGKRATVNVEEVMEILLQILAGLDYVHKEGLIHRDLKPANIFRSEVSGRTEWKIGDFGLSKSTPPQGAGTLDTPVRSGGLTELDDDSIRDMSIQNTTEVGTALYASPEQASAGSSDISEKTDMFSIGVILVELFVRFTTWHHRRDELTRARNRQWDQIDDGNFERDLCGLELMARECLDPLPEKRPTAEKFYHFMGRLLDRRRQKSAEPRDRAASADTGASGGHAGNGHTSLGVGARSNGSLGPRQRSGIPAMELQPERFFLHVWGTDEDGTLGTRVQGFVQQTRFAAPNGGKYVRVEKYEQVEGHEQVTLRYVLTNVRPGTGISDICDELKPQVEGVLDCKGGAYGSDEDEPGPQFDDAEEPLKMNHLLQDDGGASATGRGPDSASDSDAASAPSGPGYAL